MELDRFALVDGSYQHNLLRDEGRLDSYAKAIAAAVRPGDAVADLGSGSGVLAHVAASAGARRVYAVEAQQHSFATLQRLLHLNGLEGRVVPVLADAEAWEPPEPVQVAVCELMETGLLHEPMAAAVRRIHGWPSGPRAIVPRGARLLVEGVRLEDAFHGYRAPLPGFRASGAGRAVTDAACYADLDFEAAAPPEGVDTSFKLRCREGGPVHALRLRTETLLGPGVRYESGPGYCTPVVLPLAEALHARAGQELEGSLAYRFAFGADPLRFDLAP